MAAPGTGFELPRRDVSWLKRDVLLFAASVGCSAADELHFLYELHPKFAVFPAYAVILPFKGTSQEVTDFHASEEALVIQGVPVLDSRHMLDGQRAIEFFKALPTSSAGREFELRSTILGVYDKGKPGTVVETEHRIVDKASGEIYTRAVGTQFYVGQGGWGGPRGPTARDIAPPARAPDASCALPLCAETAHLYRLNGDYNPLHATPAPGEKMGLGGPVLHGLFSWNAAAHAVLRTFGASDPANIREFQARFASPVRPGDTLQIEMWNMGGVKDGWQEIRFLGKLGDGTIALRSGRAIVKVSQSRQSRL